MESTQLKNNPEPFKRLLENLRLHAVSFFGNIWNRICFRISLRNENYQKSQAAMQEYIAREKYR